MLPSQEHTSVDSVRSIKIIEEVSKQPHLYIQRQRLYKQLESVLYFTNLYASRLSGGTTGTIILLAVPTYPYVLNSPDHHRATELAECYPVHRTIQPRQCPD